MSLTENRMLFAYESSIHSANILLSLNDQRKRDLLCDVTVLVEDQPFRAHRCVLAACSSYFLSRIVGQSDTDLVITLPEEVTVKGFNPLIQFAYTAKLILSKDNVDEVCKCVQVLGMHDVEESCFQFLRLKFLNPAAGQQEDPAKECGRKASATLSPLDPGELDTDEAAEPLDNGHLQASRCNVHAWKDHEEAPPPTRDQTYEACSGKGGAPGSASLGPKYRKFQKAFGTDRVPTGESSIQEIPASAFVCVPPRAARDCPDFPRTPKHEDVQVEMGDEEEAEPTENPCRRKAEVAQPPPEPAAAAPGFYALSLLHPYEQYGEAPLTGVQNLTVLSEGPSGADGGADKAAPSTSAPGRQEEQPAPADERSSVEREVAEHLAKGFWTDLCSLDASGQPQLAPAKACAEHAFSPRRSECPWLGIRISESPEQSQRTFTTLNAVSCPFINTLSAEECANDLEIGSDDFAPEPQPEPCPYACVISLGDDSETDTEGDSESCSAREQECEVKLPFNAQRIISLSRNDFQSLLKMHKLTPEQLDCIHDIRRRSKNRIAAQRCRKRKLDCIQNLELEIEKLQKEKESLLKERDHILSTLGETKQNLTGLCQQVCKEAALSHEQIQILAKYSASDCPLTLLISEKEKTTPDCKWGPPSCVDLPPGLPDAPRTREQNSPYPCVKEMDSNEQQQQGSYWNSPRTSSLLMGPCCPSGGIPDFCPMTGKCTTED
ncbi:transcription regulator protein BACH1 isoform X1 [Monodelphis domestica]|uniref:transcription regulator protein BACH1 isoform X1 n=1 Tax=Monodelphis domestica TaxID=13616 RepID=UPI0024E20C7C|nr:transcription regulator protein BACH1 isoform X1 [Monodelphis domestica]XP_007493149.2 transcription regulator protein BACH1 isoform X1 [Monodelphis domestica]XP_056681946.1 transcription regulator protein BACH1 isoform X1 [Monodelphis domestica]